ncbi:MAG TPA: twitching motility protein PilT [Bacteroidales bacterium]|nr:twitching motility protein PilT [Bacteroidales bacterium]
MKVVRLRFYEELNDFLPTARKKEPFLHQFTGNPSVKDLIESLGVPHAEVDMILVNGSSVDFSYKPTDEDQISVYPVFESLDISEVTHLRRRPLRRLKFICDVHLGKMARNLRLLGFDTFFDRNIDDNEIINMSISEKRIILTRDRQLLKNNRITHGYWIRSSDPREQIREAVARFDLRNNLKPFTRCMDCNGLIRTVSKEDIIELLPPRTRQYYEEFFKCNVCGKIYWEGSHYENMKKQIQKLPD